MTRKETSDGASSGEGVSAGSGELMKATLGSSIPSAMLEQDAQTFGFLDKTFPFAIMGSPQHMQTVGFTH
jgi:hypothetical protein